MADLVMVECTDGGRLCSRSKKLISLIREVMEWSQVFRWYVLEKLPDTEISEANNIPVSSGKFFCWNI